jgi:hypothetical protein
MDKSKLKIGDILKVTQGGEVHYEKVIQIAPEVLTEDMPTSVHQPELNVIIERLQSAVNRYDGIVCETKSKLQTIKRYDEPSTLKEAMEEKQPESVTEEIIRLLYSLNDLNEKAESNLRHLREIV